MPSSSGAANAFSAQRPPPHGETWGLASPVRCYSSSRLPAAAYCFKNSPAKSRLDGLKAWWHHTGSTAKMYLSTTSFAHRFYYGSSSTRTALNTAAAAVALAHSHSRDDFRPFTTVVESSTPEPLEKSFGKKQQQQFVVIFQLRSQVSALLNC